MTPGYDASAPPRPGEGSLRSDDHGTADGRAADSCGAAHDRGPADDHGTADARDTDATGTADDHGACRAARGDDEFIRSEEHTSELQSRGNLVCCLLLEKNN